MFESLKKFDFMYFQQLLQPVGSRMISTGCPTELQLTLPFLKGVFQKMALRVSHNLFFSYQVTLNRVTQRRYFILVTLYIVAASLPVSKVEVMIKLT